MPANEEQWEECRQDYLQSTEGSLSNPNIPMEQFKIIFYAKAYGAIPAIIALPGFYLPMFYFLARGHFGKKMKKIMYLSLAVTAVNVAIALQLDKSVNKKPHTEEDYSLRQNYVEAFAPHLLGNAILFGIGFWALLTAARGHPSASYKTIQQAIGAAKYRGLLHRTSLTFALTLFTGYIIGVNGGGLASNTFPKLT